MDDLCLGYLLQGMCYRCVSKPKEAMESLLNTVNRSVFLLPATCLLVSFSLLIFVMDLESERDHKITRSYDIMTFVSHTLCDKTNIIMIVDNPSNNFATTPLVETHLMT